MPTIRDVISHDELSRIFEKGNTYDDGNANLRILGGVVDSQGLSRVSFGSTLAQGSAHFCINYSKTSKLVFVEASKFEKKWFGLFGDSISVKKADIDYFWFIVSEEKTA